MTSQILSLFFTAKLGFRSVARVLSVLAIPLGIQKPPSHQSIINWVIKLSIAKVQNICTNPIHLAQEGFVWIFDISIALGAGKILCVLRIKSDIFASSKGAPGLKDCECIFVGVSNSWNGEKISSILKNLINIAGRPLAVVKDGGLDLAKAMRILGENGIRIAEIADISHFFANLLKNKYEDSEQFKEFLSLCGNISKKFKQSILACLAPPKVSHKARFMNVHKLFSWALKILNLSPTGRAKNSSNLQKLRDAIDVLPELKQFIDSFSKDSKVILNVQKILKNSGMNIKSKILSQDEIDALPDSSKIKIGLQKWINEQFTIAEILGLEKKGMLISSDNIESLFGKGKQRYRAGMHDAHRIALMLPSHCGSLSNTDIKNTMEISTLEKKGVEAQCSSLTSQKRKLLGNRVAKNRSEELEKLGISKDLMIYPKFRQEQRTESEVKEVDYKGLTRVSSIHCGPDKTEIALQLNTCNAGCYDENKLTYTA